MADCRPKILMLVEGTYGPLSRDANYWGGFIRYLHPAVCGLREHGFDCFVRTLRERSPLHPLVESSGCETFALGARTSRGYPRAAMRLARIIRDHHVDLVHAHEAIQGSIATLATARSAATLIFHRHHTVIEGQEWLTNVAQRGADLTLAVSQAVAARAIEDGTPQTRVRVANNGVAPLRAPTQREIFEIRRNLQVGEGETVVLVVGHLRPEKGHKTLLEAVALIAPELSTRLHIVIVGSGSEATALQSEARSLRHLFSTHFAGHQGDVAPWYAMCDVVAMPSYREPFGLVALEAMAAERPLIASATGGLSEIVIDGVSGLLVPPRSAQELALALNRLLTSPDLSQRLAAAGKVRYEAEFSMDAMVQRWISAYSEAQAIAATRGRGSKRYG